MTITCEQCGADFDAGSPGAAGSTACPKCHHANTVPFASVGPREISLSSFDADASQQAAGQAPLDLSAGGPDAPVMPELLLTDAALGDVDFSSLSAPPPATPPLLDLDEEPDLPAPVQKSPLAPPPRAAAAAAEPDIVDLPAPRAAQPPRFAPSTPPVTERPDGGLDLPAPRDTKPPVRPPSFPGAKSPPPFAPPQSSSAPEIEVPLDLDAPDIDDADIPELPGPRVDVDLPTPRIDADLPAPRVDRAVDLPGHRTVRAAADVVPLATGDADSLSDLLEPEPPQTNSFSDAPAEPRRRNRLPLILGGAVVVLLAGGGIAAWKMGLFSGQNRAEVEVAINNARTAIGSDTMIGFREVTRSLAPLSGGDHPNERAALLEAQAHFLEAHLGVSGELALGKALLAQPVSRAPSPADRAAAEGLRALDEGDLVAARTALEGTLATSPNDAAVLAYLGWVELAGRDVAAATAAFKKSVAADASRAQGHYGLALATERSGDDKGAAAGYAKVLGLQPDHVRARFGQLRVAARGGDNAAATKLQALVTAQASTLTKGELAEAYASLGQIAIDAGRRDEAEERFKKAASLDSDIAHSHIAWDAALGLARLRVSGPQPASAVDDLRKLVALDARGVEPRLLLAQAVLAKGEVDEADTLLTAVEQLRPKEARVALLRGRLIESRSNVTNDDRQKAVELYQQATIEDPKLIEAWTSLARAQHALGKMPEALAALGKAVATLGGNAQGAATIGAAYLAIGQPAEAEARFRAVLDDNKSGGDLLPVWLGLGESLEAQNKLDEAKKVYAEALKLAPSSPMFIEREARVAVRSSQLDEGKRLFDEALKLGNPTAPLRLAAAELAITQHRLDDARALSESVVKDDDRSAVGTLVLAKVELESGHPEDAIVLARRAVMLQDLPEAHFVLGEVLEGENKFDAASTEYSLARRPPTTDRAALGRARMLVRLGQSKEALTELAPLAKSGPLRAEALLLEGDCLSDMQQADKARHAYEDAVRAAPQSAEAAFKYGRALLDAGQRGPGLVTLARAVKLAPSKTAWLPDAWVLLADAYRMGRQNDAAIHAYQQYLLIAPPSSPTRSEAERQLEILGGSAP
ncbi:MAG: tetratricopeptide repeat protein [Polyangia bacterium]